MVALLQKSLRGEWFAYYHPSVSSRVINSKFEDKYGYPPAGVIDAPGGGRLAGPLRKPDEPKDAI